jgi:hypothetical protein
LIEQRPQPEQFPASGQQLPQVHAERVSFEHRCHDLSAEHGPQPNQPLAQVVVDANA